ncbi:response regulator transcription factor [Paenibacillus tarimensis]|uniref:response regulator transcription factor n=1 Tax=Paenibacillus tarimensis TaxID=416012 RepID=UPI001F3EC53C|nr:response regulator [Paenibacillus tarimensis]MCF2944313.1 response regulator [Paenibacillus tarimensis]
MDILIVDDETVIREGIKRTLQNRFPACGIHLASGGEEALELLSRYSISIVLTDILMPGMNGLQLIQKSRSRYPHIKWVVISAYSEFSYAQEAVRLGAKDYLLKPIGKDAIIDMTLKLSEEVQREQEMTEEAEQLQNNRKYWREAIFQRWASGLDIGGIDMKPFMESHPVFYLLLVKMESDKPLNLEHFMVENVMGELIERHGNGFVAIHDSCSLLGLVTLRDGASLNGFLDELRRHLVRCLKVPFQVMHSPRIEDYRAVPDEVRRMRESASMQVYEHYSEGGERAVEVALQYMKTHYHGDLSLEKVASVVYLNPVYFSQLFKQKTGSGFKEYVIQLRLEQARRMLGNPKLKLADVARRVGYQDIRHFSQQFRRRFGATPSEYRQSGACGDKGRDSVQH